MGERWTTAQVAEYCGVRPSTYRNYVSEGRAPGPLAERDPESGAKLYDADAVKVWHASRPGPGSRTDLAPGAEPGAKPDWSPVAATGLETTENPR